MMLDVIIIGAGFSGLAMGIALKKADIHNFLILEKSADLGGTWRDNTYPGAECDIPSALYSYSYEPNPAWDFKWSNQKQILSYLEHCAHKYDLVDHVRYKQAVTALRFNNTEDIWRVDIQGGDLLEARFVVSAIGQLHIPRWPDIPGMASFEGPTWHSAEWNHDIDLSGSKVGVIGNAASAVQFIPEIAKSAGEVHIFQRSANWMISKPDREYRNWEKKLRKRIPVLLKMDRFRLWLMGEAYFSLMGQNRLWKAVGEWRCRRYIKRTVKDAELRKKLVPDYPIGAKRILLSDNYYPSLNLEHVCLHTDAIASVLPGGVQAGDSIIDLDVLIYATGFRTNPFLSQINVEGSFGRTLAEAWNDGEKAYLGIAVAGFPNFFMMYGPNTNLGHNSIIIMSECQARYIAQCIEHTTERGYHRIEVKEDVMFGYDDEIQERLKRTAWALIDESWYKSGDRIPNNWPGRTTEYARRTRRVNFRDFNII